MYHRTEVIILYDHPVVRSRAQPWAWLEWRASYSILLSVCMQVSRHVDRAGPETAHYRKTDSCRRHFVCRRFFIVAVGIEG